MSDEVLMRFSAGAPLDEVLSACVRGYTLQTVFARDLAAAQGDGLLTLTGLEAPCELAGCVMRREMASLRDCGDVGLRYALNESGDLVLAHWRAAAADQ